MSEVSQSIVEVPSSIPSSIDAVTFDLDRGGKKVVSYSGKISQQTLDLSIDPSDNTRSSDKPKSGIYINSLFLLRAIQGFS